jgi:magnesium chelatase family protein
LLPPLSRDEALEVTRIYSSCGLVNRKQGLVTTRPVRTPHHTASAPAVIGGGTIPRPGEVSLAHRGVLFLDEMPEFNRSVLETLRQPMEDGVVTISRAHSSIRFPAEFMLVAAVNPTLRGLMPTDEYGKKAMEKYLSRISGPLVDRIDIHVEVPAIPYATLRNRPSGKSSAEWREVVLNARGIQRDRQGAGLLNRELTGRALEKHAALDQQAELILGQAVSELGLSARAYDKVRRVARTIADLENETSIAAHHIAEAVQYRLLDWML